MEIELQEIRDFIAAIPPLDRLPENVLNALTQALSIQYVRRGGDVSGEPGSTSMLHILRQGAIAMYSGEDNLIGMLGEGDICTSFCAADVMPDFYVKATEDTLLYSIPCDELSRLVDQDESVLHFIRHSAAQRLKQAVARMQEQSSSNLLHTYAGEICRAPLITADPDYSIRECAMLMSEKGVSSLVILEDHEPAGLITDRDIRKRCVAHALDVDTPVKQIMTRDIISISASDSLFDALLVMTRNQVHHLPVFGDEGDITGVITTTDIMRQEGVSAVHLTSTIRKAESLETLVEASKMLPRIQLQLVNMGADLHHLGYAITAISGAITRRLIEMAEDKLGPPPVPYAWIAAGSQARREQTSHSDQDNGIIISDKMQPGDDAWFESLARFVNDGLNACGFIYCPGDVMASNPKWRQTASAWQAYFDKWIEEPEPMALMLSSIFFDLRVIHGKEKLLRKIRRNILKKTPKNQLFLAHMTRNALTHRPPLGFFRDFVLVHDGQHDDTLDLKHSGLVPIIDMARIYALAEGLKEISTEDRLRAAAGTASLSKGGSANLLDAFEFISNLRLEHQAAQIQAGDDPDNFMSPRQLSKLEREHLKDAFKVVQTMQATLEMRYQTGRI
ncbi:putative nucleotidyltransferase substrate binding domain-containing protein [Thiolapillus brandeum]|uniref:CBS domain-containing protein n=1 Tax=Thiolapillus brandeum TaxID=1076588 RepID=A0A7U6JI88_9GAMM|nr:putative nucleotidyltransferase substrate binding domain-containing protein [Thiolapillus brandeum]BAO43990.1 CBS domain-containing protein [Thiolapillus brandeum]